MRLAPAPSILCCLLAGWVPALPAADEPILIHGRVLDTDGDALPGVAVSVNSTIPVARTDALGRFTLRGVLSGRALLAASLPGFQTLERQVDLDRAPLRLEVVLEPRGYTEVVEVVVSPVPTAFSPDELPAAVHLTGLDVLTTAGTLADPFRAAQMLPGVAKIDEGAGLFVRGGDVSETATYLDRAFVAHPHRFETTNGGLFGTVQPWLISGLSLTTGGFPARYGNALSGVLELHGLERPEQRQVMMSLSLAAASAMVSVPVGERGGLRLSGNRSNTRALFSVNQPERSFSRYPSGTDLNVSYEHDLLGIGRIQVGGYRQDERAGVEIEDGNFTGFLNTQDRNELYSLRWRAILSSWAATATLSRSDYHQELAAGVVDLDEDDRRLRARVDLERPGSVWIVRAGTEWENRQLSFTGRAAVRGGDLGGVEGTRLWQLDAPVRHLAAYVELERAWSPAVRTNIGLRGDSFSPFSLASVDPRLELVFTPVARHSFRLAAGLYHQIPEPQFLDPEFGNPTLGLMRSRHLVIGYQLHEDTDPLFLRIETYDKSYRGLPVEDPDLLFSDAGHGSARGADLLLKLARGRVSGWFSYSAVRARRLSTRWEDFGRFPVPDAPVRPVFEIPNSLQIAMNIELPGALTLGGSLRHSSGRPFTPVVEALETPTGFVPVHGAVNSDRFPDYQRLDLSISYPRPFLANGLAVLFLGVTNVFDRRNVVQHAYSPDFSKRRPARTSFGRSFYFGFSVQF